MQRRRTARERERWLSAVLIVTAIVGVSAAVRFWPVSLPQRVPRPLASRALLVIDPPVLPIQESVLWHQPVPAEPVVSFPAPPVIAAEIADESTPAPDVPVAPREVPAAPPADAFLLASRRLDVLLDAPSITYRPEPVIVLADDDSHALMELPAVAVTRVVTVAGRGIRTGVRATTAVFRAAF